jgi:hypothetical protein
MVIAATAPPKFMLPRGDERKSPTVLEPWATVFFHQGECISGQKLDLHLALPVLAWAHTTRK